MFSADNPLASFIRVSTFLQLLACLSLLFACQRSQILLLLTGKQEAANQAMNILFSTVILFIPGLLAVVYPQVQNLAASLGAIGGMLTIYFLPTITFLRQAWVEVKDPHLIKRIRRNQDLEEQKAMFVEDGMN
jgi:hypothetical protein